MNPGSEEAHKAGCTCPIMDNSYGCGAVGWGDVKQPQFWINGNCPIHGNKSQTKSTRCGDCPEGVWVYSGNDPLRLVKCRRSNSLKSAGAFCDEEVKNATPD